MEDAQIIDHFFRRDPEALRAAQEKYEKRCLAAARHILPDARDAEECVSDVWLRLWNAIPPERPRSLAAYITTVTVNGNYVVLEVLPEGCTVPDAFLARF